MLPFLRRLFQRPEGSSWQALAPSAQVRDQHQRWVTEQVYRNWLQPYYQAYHQQKAGLPRPGLRAQVLDEPNRRGAVLFYDPSIGPGNFRHLFDYLADRVVAAGYNCATSDQRELRHERYTETILKHFLKPPPRQCSHTGRCVQHYGCITVDLVLVNGQPGFIRLFSNVLQDQIFTPAQPFEELFRELFDQPGPTAETQALIPHYFKK